MRRTALLPVLAQKFSTHIFTSLLVSIRSIINFHRHHVTIAVRTDKSKWGYRYFITYTVQTASRVLTFLRNPVDFHMTLRVILRNNLWNKKLITIDISKLRKINSRKIMSLNLLIILFVMKQLEDNKYFH